MLQQLCGVEDLAPLPRTLHEHNPELRAGTLAAGRHRLPLQRACRRLSLLLLPLLLLLLVLLLSLLLLHVLHQ